MAYDYLKPFTYPLLYSFRGGEVRARYENYFEAVDEKDIQELETLLGCSLPSQLLEFYREIGCGFLRYAINSPDRGKNPTGFSNRILDPTDIYAIKAKTGEYPLYEYSIFGAKEIEFQEHEIPVFEICDSQYFMVMHPWSDKPNAVYEHCSGLATDESDLIEEDFSTFIYNLYHKGANYYAEGR